MSKKDDQNINSGGGPIFMGDVNNSGKIAGRSDNYQNGMSADDVGILFESIFTTIDHHARLSKADKDDLKTEVEELREELSKKENANESFLMRRLRNIGRMAPDILEVTLAAIVNPAAGFGMVAKKIADKVKASAG